MACSGAQVSPQGHECDMDTTFWIVANQCADQDSVRLLSVEGCAALGKLLEPADCITAILPVIVSFSQVCAGYQFKAGFRDQSALLPYQPFNSWSLRPQLSFVPR